MKDPSMQSLIHSAWDTKKCRDLIVDSDSLESSLGATSGCTSDMILSTILKDLEAMMKQCREKKVENLRIPHVFTSINSDDDEAHLFGNGPGQSSD